MYLSQDALDYVLSAKDELMDLERTLCAIPSPSHQEHRRAAFCKEWLEKAGAKGVYIDEVQNVIFPINAEGSSRLTLFAAHMDTVFPDTEPMPMREEDGILYCPGAGDDTGSVALVLIISKYLISRNIQPEDGFLMVCNTCEEVDQSGITHVVDTYQGRLKEAYMMDGLYNQVVNWPVAYQKYKVHIHAQGGHAYLNFGNPSAVVCAASMINEIYALPLPEGCKSSYNVGLISGGTPVNAIPQTVDMAVELRSEIEANLNTLRGQFREIVEKYRKQGTYEIQVEDDGSLPGKGDVDEARQGRINEKIRAIFGEYLEGDTIFRSGAGDLNIPASRGVPGVGFCAYKLGRIHSREEYIDLNSLENALRASLAVVLSCVND